MADFIGQDFTNAALLATPNGRSSDVTAATQELTTWPLSFTGMGIAASRGTPEPAVSITHRSIAGSFQGLFGAQLFERVIVIPSVKALGFVLSATQFAVEVWNAFQNSDQILTAIVLEGTGGVILADPYGEPLVFGALDSRLYEATIPSSGTGQIAQEIVFQFASGILGADISITGSRIMVFSVAPDWSEGLVETISYLTDVMIAYSDNEQRRALRQIPRRGLKYRASALSARNSAGMESLVWGWQNQPFGVPWWQDQTPMTGDTPAGSFAVPCVTTDRQFAPGGIAVIWVDEFTFEALTIATVSPTGITVTSPTQFSWKAGPATLVMPIFLGRMKSEVQVDRLWSAADTMEIEFAGEAQQPAPTPTIALTQYKGFDVLELGPNWANDLKRTYTRSIVILDPKIGPISAVDKGGTAIVSQEFPWWLENHAAVTMFRAFLIARFGQLRPFWVPTWDQDLVLALGVGSTDTGITIASEFYSRFFFPTKARRYIAFIPTDGSGNVYREITAAVDNGDGTELLTLDSPTGKAFSSTQTQISFLTLAKLASDDNEIAWMNSDLAQANIQFQEVPREVP